MGRYGGHFLLHLEVLRGGLTLNPNPSDLQIAERASERAVHKSEVEASGQATPDKPSHPDSLARARAIRMARARHPG